jgi:hypothetical protein
MPARFNKKIDPPINRSTYTQLIKECCINLKDCKEYVGKCIASFRDAGLNEERNFKFTVKSENGQKLFCLRVTGGYGGIARTKYYVNHSGIYRYDWRTNFWEKIKEFFNEIIEFCRSDTGKMAIKYAGRALSILAPAMALPSIDLPSIGLPDVSLPNLSLPNVSLRDAEVPKIKQNKYEHSYETKKVGSSRNKFEKFSKCIYFKGNKSFCIKFSCCDDWVCCRYCHMDNIKHKISHDDYVQIYCLTCFNTSRGFRTYCLECNNNFSDILNYKTIADRCRFLKNSVYIPMKSCCDRVICCYRCHNEYYDHKATRNKKYLCCNCSEETSLDTDYCDNCYRYLKTDEYNLKKIANGCSLSRTYYYLLSFSCCSVPYCCYSCHDKLEDHESTYTNKKMCISCETINITSQKDFICNGCSKFLFSR